MKSINIKSTYRTLSELSEGLYKEKGSKFIGYAVACYSEEEAKQYLEIWKKTESSSKAFVLRLSIRG